MGTIPINRARFASASLVVAGERLVSATPLEFQIYEVSTTSAALQCIPHTAVTAIFS
jgi:hypothetical protein